MKGQKVRFWEIDLLRGFSVILMIGFHSVYDFLSFSANSRDFPTDVPQLDLPLYIVWQRATAILFLLLVGISLTLSGSKSNSGEKILPAGASWERYRNFFARGVLIFGWGMVITVVTRLFLGQGYVVFGILHLIGLSIVVSYPFLKHRDWNLAWSALVIGLGIWLSRRDFSFPWLVWAGFKPSGFFSVDYFPFFPWFGFVLGGIFIGNIFYQNGKRRLTLPENAPGSLSWLCFLGKKSLLIYLIHQPALLSLLALLQWSRGSG